MRHNQIQDDQHYETTEDSAQTANPPTPAKPPAKTPSTPTSAPTKPSPTTSNSWPNTERPVDNLATPLCGVRRVVRYETGAHWEVAHDTEQLDELTETANAKPCPHPDDRAWTYLDRKYCGRCGHTIKEGTAA